jgi:hypothetical protein
LTPFQEGNLHLTPSFFGYCRIKEDDKLIKREGVDTLTESELRSACRQRGMLMVENMTVEEMRKEVRFGSPFFGRWR